LSGPGTFAKQRYEQRIDELLDLATRDPAEAARQSRRFLEWLAKHGSRDPEVEAAMDQLRSLLELLRSP
jgi:hypothetical protein